ncbi:MAG: LAGLIDADG family homing endonuclease [Candidatus Woesearchaeota archaeon]
MLKNIKLNEEICEFIGAFIGDGYMGNYGKHKSQYLIGIAGDKKLDLDYFKNYLKPLIKRNFPFTNPKIYFKKNENSIMLTIYSKELYHIFLELGFNTGKKSRVVKIPHQILKNDLFMKSAIRGIFDTDGCLYFDKRKPYLKPYPRITLQIASQKLLKQLEKFLSNHFNLYLNYNNRNGYRNYIEIYGHDQLEKFLKLISFSNKRHLIKLQMPL